MRYLPIFARINIIGVKPKRFQVLSVDQQRNCEGNLCPLNRKNKNEKKIKSGVDLAPHAHI